MRLNVLRGLLGGHGSRDYGSKSSPPALSPVDSARYPQALVGCEEDSTQGLDVLARDNPFICSAGSCYLMGFMFRETPVRDLTSAAMHMHKKCKCSRKRLLKPFPKFRYALPSIIFAARCAGKRRL